MTKRGCKMYRPTVLNFTIGILCLHLFKQTLISKFIKDLFKPEIDLKLISGCLQIQRRLNIQRGVQQLRRRWIRAILDIKQSYNPTIQ